MKKLYTVAGLILMAALLMLTAVGCEVSIGPADGDETAAEAAPDEAEITRVILDRGLVGAGLELTDSDGIERILDMLDVPFELASPWDERCEAVGRGADVVLRLYSGDSHEAVVYVTNDCRVCVIDACGRVWYAETPAVDTVLICAEFPPATT